MRTSRRVLRCLLVAVAVSLAWPALAQQAGDLAEKRSDLDDLKRRIRELQKDMAQTEASRSGAATALAEAERAVSRVEREVRRLGGEKADAERKLALLEAEQREVEGRIAARQDELAEWLRRHYMHGAADGVAPLLSARDPNQLARDAHYLEHLGRARLGLIESLRADLKEKAMRAAEIGQRRDRVVALAAEQQARQAELASVHETRKQALALISDQLKTQQKEVSALRQDEQRLGRLIDTLVQRAREAAARQAAARRAAEQQAARERAAAAAASPPSQGSQTPRRSEPVVGEVRHAAGATPTGVSFAQLRGQLRFPVRGELVGRFGAPRAEGGTTWKGVFIRAGNGSEVRAVAGGEVVFSDWLRGYGNLLIIDHGGDYLSVYGNNDALLKEVGDKVGGGDAIASVGASGGVAESGLYFEIRHQGRPLDPMLWVRLN
ncbi:peptidoglycan DD-metalloendopeptidase family protein [Azoarcus sp. TTM-91]|uniref:murein hydrolase activator EnvC family protein n=1 Tax=Azoarcus sp. TTM-91 TaxID=2691581 RepID=UPI00145DCD15|nr:peptidoglycan DD-metalloendopeptidase family protein [Azoarcus sp. TTM-91]NMG33568.1 peptidoglycan DD-metalloendopeptidase family protein [Azoarcus sp. TTM-91]